MRYGIGIKPNRFSGYLAVFLFLLTSSLQAQERFYNLNESGNNCYFQYVVYSPNDDYNSIKRPYLFIQAGKDQTAYEAFHADTLKKQANFNHYLFIYIPNKGLSQTDNLSCMDALVRLTTYNYKYGHSNVFFTSYDYRLKQQDISENKLKELFNTIQLAQKPDSAISSVFQEDKESYVDPNAGNKTNEDEIGSFYYEEQNNVPKKSQLEERKKAEKIYFGPPTAKNLTVKGIITDRFTKEPLPFAAVMIKGTNLGTTTNEKGFFSLPNVPTDTSVLYVQYMGYEPTRVFLTPTTAQHTMVIRVYPTSQSLESFTVVGHKDDVVLSKPKDISTIKISPKTLQNLPSLGEPDVLRSFQLMPGVSASNESSSGLYVRGGTPDQNLVLFDEFTIYHVDHLYGFFSAFNSNAMKDIQLYKGGFESKFGGRLSSVTDLVGKEGNDKKFNVGGDISLLSFNLYAEVPVGEKFTSLIAFRRSYKGFLYNKLFDEFNESSSSSTATNAGPGRQSEDVIVSSYFYDLNGKFTYQLNEKNKFTLSVFNSGDNLDNSSVLSAGGFGRGGMGGGGSLSSTTTDLTKYGNWAMSGQWNRKWTDKITGNTSASFSKFTSNNENSQTSTVIDTNDNESTVISGAFEYNELLDLTFKTDYNWDLFKFAQLQWGGFASSYNIDYQYLQNDSITILDRHDNSFLAGGYAQTRLKFWDYRIELVPGIRATYYDNTGKMYYEPRASLTFGITDEITFKAATGLYYQYVTQITREDITSGSKNFWVLADDETVNVSSSIHYVAGLTYDIGSYLFSIEGYYKDISNLSEYSLRFNNSLLGTSYDENYLNGYGFSHGLEFLIQRKAGKLNGWISYTLGEAKNHFDQYSDDYLPANQDVTHEFKVVGMYKWKRWDFSATWVYATGRPYTAPSGGYTITLLDGTTQDYYTVSTKNGLRLPDYHRADISANYKILGGKKGDKRRREIGKIGVSIFNVYNRKNVWYKKFTIQDGDILETDVTYVGITPNLTLSFHLR